MDFLGADMGISVCLTTLNNNYDDELQLLHNRENSCSQSQTYDNVHDYRNVVVCLTLECFTVLKSWL